MKIKLNGSEKHFEKEFSVLQLLENLDLTDRKVAVLLNDEIVKKEERSATIIKDGDVIEVLQMVGGG